MLSCSATHPVEHYTFVLDYGMGTTLYIIIQYGRVNGC